MAAEDVLAAVAETVLHALPVERTVGEVLTEEVRDIMDEPDDTLVCELATVSDGEDEEDWTAEVVTVGDLLGTEERVSLGL